MVTGDDANVCIAGHVTRFRTVAALCSCRWHSNTNLNNNSRCWWRISSLTGIPAWRIDRFSLRIHTPLTGHYTYHAVRHNRRRAIMTSGSGLLATPSRQRCTNPEIVVHRRQSAIFFPIAADASTFAVFMTREMFYGQNKRSFENFYLLYALNIHRNSGYKREGRMTTLVTMDWSRFQTWRPFTWNYWRQSERLTNKRKRIYNATWLGNYDIYVALKRGAWAQKGRDIGECFTLSNKWWWWL